MRILVLSEEVKSRHHILFFTENAKVVFENKEEFTATLVIGTEIFVALMELVKANGTLLISLGERVGYYILEDPFSGLVVSTLNVLLEPSMRKSNRMVVKFCEITQFFSLIEEKEFSKLLERIQVFQTMSKLKGRRE